ncbi:hypothetical protein [Nocardia flavorosea]|uniref:Uncharacterized protein n=1 Tax=Nocardia flavorosea TaxID=53429 RepID=A0A846YPM3_9NOCA|nr:hypothetical protein [Nocardia flavorosea]NKY58899.1 hypothetical protein [Nocardia flavorosea]
MHSGAAGTLVRWLLPLFLAVALPSMHHLPAAGEPAAAPAQHEPVRSVEPEAGPPAPAGALSDSAHCCTTAVVLAPESAHDTPGDHGAGHDLLHLCLAVLTALAGIVLALFVVARGMTGYTPGAVIPAVPLVWARPPPPVSRRLAALGVLRL